MSAPPLPSAFGNYALGEFVEITPPDAINWLPQTLGWLALAIALLGFAVHRGWRALQHWHRNRYRREASKRLRALPAASEPKSFVADLNRVLKITALTAYSRERVAQLSGENWANFLHRQCHQSPFSEAQLLLLSAAAYRDDEIDRKLQQQLLTASLLWVENHTVAKTT